VPGLMFCHTQMSSTELWASPSNWFPWSQARNRKVYFDSIPLFCRPYSIWSQVILLFSAKSLFCKSTFPCHFHFNFVTLEFLLGFMTQNQILFPRVWLFSFWIHIKESLINMLHHLLLVISLCKNVYWSSVLHMIVNLLC